MRVKLSDWDGSVRGDSVARRGMRVDEIDALVKHGRLARLRPLYTLYHMVVNFCVFCRWRGEIHMTGHRLGPKTRTLFFQSKH
jgi:hypothetical protein